MSDNLSIGPQDCLRPPAWALFPSPLEDPLPSKGPVLPTTPLERWKEWADMYDRMEPLTWTHPSHDALLPSTTVVIPRPAKPVVLLDCDGVLSDFMRTVRRVYYERTGIVLMEHDFPTWDMYKVIPKGEIESDILAKGFCASIPPLAPALEWVPILKRLAEVKVITSPWGDSMHWMPERRDWLRKHFGFETKSQGQIDDKTLVCGDIFIDDKPANVRAWQEAWPTRKALLFDTSYNRDEEAGIRVRGWEEVMQHVMRTSAKKGMH